METGYYIRFGSEKGGCEEHVGALGVIVIDDSADGGKIQLSGAGEVVSVVESETYVHMVEDLTGVYLSRVAGLASYTREVYFVDKEYFVIIDDVLFEDAGDVSFYLQSSHDAQIDDTIVTFAGEKAKVDCEIMLVSSGVESMAVESGDSTLLKMQTRRAKKHTIVTVVCPSETETYKEIGTIRDDQGHDIFLYFVNDGKTFPLVIDGNKRY